MAISRTNTGNFSNEMFTREMIVIWTINDKENSIDFGQRFTAWNFLLLWTVAWQPRYPAHMINISGSVVIGGKAPKG